ncbi:MAG: sulfite exporter TauE/SafE family protein [Verrucomicrobiota bacterium]
MSTTTLLTCLGIGILAGIIAALCGVGGGVVMVPAFVSLLAMPQKTAVATSLAIIIPTAAMATTQNAKNGFVDWKVAAVTAVSASLFAYFGADWMKTLSNTTLTRVFGTILVIFGTRMLWLGKA